MSTATAYTLSDLLEAPLTDLLREAARKRHERFGNEVEFCAIVNAKSGHCTMDCRFCAQSVHYDTNIEPHPLVDEEFLVSETQRQWNRGIRRIGWVTSGCSVDDAEVMVISEAATRCRGGRLCASLGQCEREALLKLKEAGITRYHHNLETSEAHYPNVCKTQRWGDRLATVLRAKSAGLEVCCGGLFGIGESWEDRYDLAMVLREIDVDSVPINFLRPIPGTPFADRPILSADEGLRIIALFRLLLPEASIRICGGRPATFGDRQAEILTAGADALMTGDYLTTSGITPESDFQMIRKLGYRPRAGDKGNSDNNTAP